MAARILMSARNFEVGFCEEKIGFDSEKNEISNEADYTVTQMFFHALTLSTQNGNISSFHPFRIVLEYIERYCNFQLISSRFSI